MGTGQRVMHYRRVSYRHTMVVHGGQTWPFSDIWQLDRLRLLVQARWRPDADMCETATTVEIVVDLAGVGEEDFEVQLFEDALVIEGHRLLPACPQGGRYHIAGIRQGPFRVELPLPAPVDPERVEVRYESGLLNITLAKRRQAG
jgi:HSP20 family protein